MAALEGPQLPLHNMVAEFVKRRDYIVERLNSIKEISCLKPQGAFYIFPDVSQITGRTFKGEIIKDSVFLAEILLDEANVAVVPGSAFGADEYLRLSYATSMENISKGLESIEGLMNKIL